MHRFNHRWQALAFSSEAQKLTAEIKEIALKSGASLVGIVSARAIDALPKIWVGWTIKEYTKKAVEVMPNARSVIVIGYHVWDGMLEMAIRKGEGWTYPGYFPLDYLEQKVVNRLQKAGHEACSFYSSSCKRLAQLAGFGTYGKNALIISPVFGPWLRFSPMLTDAEMLPDSPFEKDLCGECVECVKACPVGALSPYKVDDEKCLVGIHLTGQGKSNHNAVLAKYEPSLTENSHLMCTECQKACRYGRNKHSSDSHIHV
jgi:epoxyqueuosine reductase QueG